jgi:hypothetical protein
MTNPFLRETGPGSTGTFPVRRIGPYRMSVQADAHGRACCPKVRLDDIRHYETVEVDISGPSGTIEVQRAGFPPEVRALFPEGGGSKARRVTQEGVLLIESHLRKLANQPAPPAFRPTDDAREPVSLTNAGLREVLLKIEEALGAETGVVNEDLVSAMSDLVQAARDRGIDFDGLVHVQSMTSGGPTP